MIGLYAQNENTQSQLHQLLQDASVEIYQPAHDYHLVIWLSNEKPPRHLNVLTEKDLSLPITATEWRLLIQKYGVSTPCYQNKFFMIETDKRLLINLKTKQQISLTEKENELLAFLIQAPQHTATRDTLLQSVWQYNPEAETHTVESHLYSLKQKIGPDFEVLFAVHNGAITLR